MRSNEAMIALVWAAQAIADQDLDGLPDSTVRATVLDLHDVLTLLQGQLIRAIGVFDARGLSVDDGCRSTRSWLRSFARESESTAGDHVRGARVLRALPGLASASRDGELPMDHLRHVTRLAQRVGVDVVAGVEPVLMEAATQLNPGDFGRVCARVRAHVDPDGEAHDAAKDFDRRGLTLASFDGMVMMHGQLDAEGGATLTAALNALMPPPGQGDPRSARQRRADALVELARGALTEGRLPTVGGVRPQVGILVTPQQLIGVSPSRLTEERPSQDAPTEAVQTEDVTTALTDPARTEAARTEAARTEAALTEAARTNAALTNAALSDVAPPWLEWVGDIPPSVAHRIACDSDVWRVVLDPATGLPVNVGRKHRLVPTWIRRALIARDRGCRFPGCRAPASWTDAHHWRPWSRGGRTDVSNLVLLCRFHHVLVHEGRWDVRPDPRTGEVIATRPDGRPYEIRDHRNRLSTG